MSIARRPARCSRLLSPCALALTLAVASGCGRSAAVQTASSLPLQRVVIYRNGVGYFERQGHVEDGEVRFRVTQREVGDFLATLAVMERGGSSVRAAAFPLPEERADGAPPPADARRTVTLALDGRAHDLLVGYTVETPIWRPSYRLVFNGATAQVQAWGIVQNLSGEDWRGVRLSLVAGSPVSFRSELATPVIPVRPVVTDEGAVIDAVPTGETTLAVNDESIEHAQPAPAAPQSEACNGADDNCNGVVDALQQRAQGQTVNRRMHFAREAMQPTSGTLRDHAFEVNTATTRSQAPRNVASLAALAVQGGSTRYDLPNAVTIPDRSATMVMLVARDIPGSQMYLFAPDPGVADSVSHPFHVARFENRTGALLERGPLAIFEEGAFLGQGMLDPLPDGATTTVPFALERALAVDHSAASAVEGVRLVRMQREALTVERFTVWRTTYRLRNGMDREARVLVRHALDGAQMHEPPAGTELANGGALVPAAVPARGHLDLLVTTRSPFTVTIDLSDEQAGLAIEQYLREGHPADDVAAALRTALDMRRQIEERARERADLEQRRQDLQQNAEETRANLTAIQRNPQAADLRAQLTARLARVATQLDQMTRRVVELDAQMSERRVRLAEAVRAIDVDTSRAAAAPAAPR